jgi:hypothetical protein
MVNEWVTNFCTPENCPFLDFYNDCRKLDRKDMQPFDIFVGMMFALFDAGGGILAQPEKTSEIGGQVYRSGYDPHSFSGHSPNKYRI